MAQNSSDNYLDFYIEFISVSPFISYILLFYCFVLFVSPM